MLAYDPSLYFSSPDSLQVNEESLSALNAFLDVVEYHTAQDHFRLAKSKLPDVYRVKFYLKPHSVDATDTEDTREDGIGLYESIRGDYRFPKQFFSQETPRRELELEAVLYINHILKQAQLPPLTLPDPPPRPQIIDNPELLRETMSKFRRTGLRDVDKVPLTLL